MGKKVQEAKSYPAPIDYFVMKIRNIEHSGLSYSFKSENPTPNGVSFHLSNGFSMRSYYEKIVITMIPTPNGTNIDIISQCGLPTQIVDWGKNADNIRELFSYLEKGMPVYNMNPPAQNCCRFCGAPIMQGAVFCVNCGHELT